MGHKTIVAFPLNKSETVHINNIELLVLVLVPKNIAKFPRQSTSRLEVHATGRGLFYACRSYGHLAVTFREGKQKNGVTPFLCPQSINS